MLFKPVCSFVLCKCNAARVAAMYIYPSSCSAASVMVGSESNTHDLYLAFCRGPLNLQNFYVGASVLFSAFGGHAMAL